MDKKLSWVLGLPGIALMLLSAYEQTAKLNNEAERLRIGKTAPDLDLTLTEISPLSFRAGAKEDYELLGPELTNFKTNPRSN